MPRRGSSSADKSQMDLAIALSKSLEESNSRQLSELAEELPASAIENDDVPQNIRQMQQDFMARLQPNPSGPSKSSRKRKKAPTAVPALLIRSSENRLAVLTEKIALTLLSETPRPTTPDRFDNLIPVNGSWCKSNLSPCDNSYVISELSDIHLTKTRSSLNETFIPERLQSPVKGSWHKSNQHSCDDSYQINKLSGDLLTEDISYLNKTFVPDRLQSPVTPPQVEDRTNKKSITLDKMDTETFIQDPNVCRDYDNAVNYSFMSDITIKTSGNRDIKAHKIILSIRCPKIMDDVRVGTLDWSSVSYDEAITFLRFIYSGQVTLAPTDRNARGLLFLARRYNIQELMWNEDLYISSPLETSQMPQRMSPDWNEPKRQALGYKASQIHFDEESDELQSEKEVSSSEHSDSENDEKVEIVHKSTFLNKAPESQIITVDESSDSLESDGVLNTSLDSTDLPPMPASDKPLNECLYADPSNEEVDGPSFTPKNCEEVIGVCGGSDGSANHILGDIKGKSDEFSDPGANLKRKLLENEPTNPKQSTLIIKKECSNFEVSEGETPPKKKNFDVLTLTAHRVNQPGAVDNVNNGEADQSTVSGLPSNNIIKQEGVTPKPDFKSMSTMDFLNQCRLYGVRPTLPRNCAINLLGKIYEQKHPVVQLNVGNGMGKISEAIERENARESTVIKQDDSDSDGYIDLTFHSSASDYSEEEYNDGEVSLDLRSAVHLFIIEDPDVYKLNQFGWSPSMRI